MTVIDWAGIFQYLNDLARICIHSGTTKISRHVDIYEKDWTIENGHTVSITDEPDLWMADVPVIDGTVSVDATRDERRSLDLTLDNEDQVFQLHPDHLWYDKIIKVYRGVVIPKEMVSSTATDDVVWERCVGEFVIDGITEDHFPYTISIKGRDRTAWLLSSQMGHSETYGVGLTPSSVIHWIAAIGGLRKFKFESTTKYLEAPIIVQGEDVRWKIIKDIALAYSLDVFIDQDGYLVVRDFRDPATMAGIYTFETGLPSGNIAGYSKQINGDRIINHQIAIGEASDRPAVVAEARNLSPTSPTAIDKIGERTNVYKSSLIVSLLQAQEAANRFLAVGSMQSYEVSMDSLVFPWLECEEVVNFVDPRPAPGDPERYWLSSFTIPLKLGTGSFNIRRITLVG